MLNEDQTNSAKARKGIGTPGPQSEREASIVAPPETRPGERAMTEGYSSSAKTRRYR